MERMVLAVTRGGSFSGSAVDTNTSMPGRSDLPFGFLRLGDSYRSLSTERSIILFTGQIFGSWSRTQEKANQISHATDIPHNQMASRFGCRILHVRNKPKAARRITISNL
uniref:Uncharacterized protein n=1 Tax=Opuntia streptacantha TaxID=393608 RepID=A0A7C9D2X2_OPUST